MHSKMDVLKKVKATYSLEGESIVQVLNNLQLIYFGEVIQI